MQQFLISLLKIPNDSLLLKEEYKANWQNGVFDDSLDEMTVIIGRKFKTGDGDSDRIYIGESTFLEKLNNCPVVALSHNNIIDLDYWLKCRVVIEDSYLIEIARYFNYNYKHICNVDSIVQKNYKWQNIHGIRISYNDRYFLFDYISKSLYKTTEPIKIEVRVDIACENPSFKPLKHKFFHGIVYPEIKSEDKTIKILPDFKEVDKNAMTTQVMPHFENYKIIYVPEDGNSAFWATYIGKYVNDALAKKNIAAPKEILGDLRAKNEIDENAINLMKLSEPQKKIVKNLRAKTVDKMRQIPRDEALFTILNKLGCWDSGSDGRLGLEVLSFVAEVINNPILVITQSNDGQFLYWLSGTTDNLKMQIIEDNNPEAILNAYTNSVSLFYDGIHFQAIISHSTLNFFQIARDNNQ